jgi:hypothetical protein
MSRITLGTLLMAVSTATAQAAEPALPEVTIRTYKVSTSMQELAAARRIVDRILGEGGLASAWLQCWSSDSSAPIPAACNQPLRAGELIVKIAPAHDTNSLSHQASLGYSYVDVQAGTGSVATVYTDRVRDLSRGAGVKNIDLLGRAIAHEIGHLLLGTNQHAGAGLMRAVWSVAELRRNAAADWAFSESEAQAIGRAVTRLRQRHSTTENTSRYPDSTSADTF